MGAAQERSDLPSHQPPSRIGTTPLCGLRCQHTTLRTHRQDFGDVEARGQVLFRLYDLEHLAGGRVQA